MKKILVFCPHDKDPQSVALCESILDLGGSYRLIPFNNDNKEIIYDIRLFENNILFGKNLSDIGAVFIRAQNLYVPLCLPPLLSEAELKLWEAKYYNENLRIKFLNSVISRLAGNGAFIINRPSAYFHHDTKAQFFHMLRMSGIPVPHTISTNDPGYFKKNGIDAKDDITKSPFGVGGTREAGKQLKKYRELLRHSPALFQEKIKGKTIRVHTVGSKVVLALKIFAEDIDSRTDTAGFEVIELSTEHKQTIAKANKLLDVHYSAWDIIIDESGQIYLLDCNPGPYIWWISPVYARHVMHQAARFLVKYCETGSTEEADKAVEESFIPFFKTVCKVHGTTASIADELYANAKRHLRIRY
jgi:hypothetical protein